MQAEMIVWAGGEHPFRLRIAELEAIQQKTERGPEHILNELAAGRWLIMDLFEVIRFGLIGGGMASADALKVTRDTFERTPLAEFKLTCLEVLSTALYGREDDPVGEADPVEPTPEDEKTADGSSQTSTASAP